MGSIEFLNIEFSPGGEEICGGSGGGGGGKKGEGPLTLGADIGRTGFRGDGRENAAVVPGRWMPRPGNPGGR